MNCDDCRRNLPARLEGLLSPEAAAKIEDHLEKCPSCRGEADANEAMRDRLAKNGRRARTKSIADDVMDAISRKQTLEPKPERTMTMLWRHKKGLAAVAASIALVAAVGTILLTGKGASVAYALDKAVAASKKVTTVHYQEWVPLTALEAEVPINGDFAKKAWADYDGIDGDLALRQEVWAEFDGEGQLLRLRIEWPVTEDGRKEIILRQDQADIWFVHKGGYLIMRDERAVSMYPQMFLDPTKGLQSLDASINAGKATMRAVKDTTGFGGGTTTYTVDYMDIPSRNALYVIDQKSHLLTEVRSYMKSGDVNTLVAVMRFLDYGKPVDAGTWVLNAPADVIRVDQLTQVIGIAQGEMTDAEVATEGVRQFFEAMITEDYETAGRLYSGVPADKMEELLGPMRFVRIVSLGEPTAPSDPRVGGLVVPYKVEIEVNGEVSLKEHIAYIRPVESQGDRWAIHGGI